MNLKCVVLGHNWTTTYSNDGVQEKVCARCGRNHRGDFEPGPGPDDHGVGAGGIGI